MMKNTIKSLLIMMLTITLSSCGGVVPKMTVTVKVTHEDGTPVVDADVGVGFQPMGIRGSGVDGRTDSNGIFSATGVTDLTFCISVKKDGYYPSVREKLSPYRNISSQESVIEDKEVTVVLRQIKDPIPMACGYYVALKGESIDTPVCYDMDKADWGHPYGIGKVKDLVFSVSGYHNGLNDSDVILSMNFENEHDGVIRIDALKDSLFKSPYLAPVDGYESSVSWQEKRIITKMESGGDKVAQVSDCYHYRSSVYIFRLRTIVDEQGKIISANYGKMYGTPHFIGNIQTGKGYIELENTYYNPKVNDRNLEYEVGRNLVSGSVQDSRPRLP